jgi:hypothetical protein
MKKSQILDGIKAGVANYCDGTVETMDTYTDRVGAIAIRATVKRIVRKKEKTEQVDFLVIAQDVDKCARLSPEDVAFSVLEEAEWETWPPKEGPLRFFGV